MKFFAITFFASALFATACGGVVGDAPDLARDPSNGSASEGAPVSAGAGRDTAPCAYLYGRASMTSRRGHDDYASSSFSFEYASQDAELTRNEFDVQYAGNLFIVNMITDDRSFIVDLGKIALRDVPRTVDPSEHPVGQWGEHDAIQAHLDHTYFVRSVDGAGRFVSAFRVIDLEPGRRVDIEWIRSTEADVMVPPLACLR
ncbi:MAG: hypothetical protein KF819_21600 [Labilithrix sp.]|nr:hypothetical protein [Labilithrix sp.]